MKSRLSILLIAVVWISGMEVYAHHSFAGTYLLEKEKIKKIEGKLVQVMFRNPHSFLQLQGNDGVRYGVEWGGATQLARGGVTRTTLKYGDQVVITGAPGRKAPAPVM